MGKQTGFTLIEMLVVLTMIAILATLAVPAVVSPLAREQVKESLALVEQLKGPVAFYQASASVMPVNNAEAGLPPPDKLLGNYVKSIEMENGAFHIAFGNKAVGMLQDKVLTVRAINVAGSPASPISWVCGYSKVPKGMEAAGQNLSTMPATLLPVACREIEEANAGK